VSVCISQSKVRICAVAKLISLVLMDSLSSVLPCSASSCLAVPFTFLSYKAPLMILCSAIIYRYPDSSPHLHCNAVVTASASFPAYLPLTLLPSPLLPSFLPSSSMKGLCRTESAIMRGSSQALTSNGLTLAVPCTSSSPLETKKWPPQVRTESNTVRYTVIGLEKTIAGSPGCFAVISLLRIDELYAPLQ
jgi:hypothetical protein